MIKIQIRQQTGVPIMAQWLTNPTSIHEDAGFYPRLHAVEYIAGVAVNCGVGHRHGSDPRLLWLRHRLVATAPIGALPGKFYIPWLWPYKRQKDKKKKNLDMFRLPVVAEWLMNPTRNYEVADLIPGLP